MLHQHTHQTPHLETALTGPLQLLEKQLLAQQNEIENWFQARWKKSPPPLYGSVDLRNAGFKLAPVDMNLFPAGFNNLNPEFLSLAVSAAKSAILDAFSQAKKILIIPEDHTRNLFYWESIHTLLQILSTAGFQVRVGTLQLEEQTITSSKNNEIFVQKIMREKNRIQLPDFDPDLILLNNDLSSGIPEILQQLDQPLLPPAELGWSQRLKSEHFQYYAEIANEFSDLLEIDPWLVAPLFRQCGEVDFMRGEGQACLVANVENLFAAIEKKYQEYQIQQTPYIVVKADAGTYGMAVMIVRSVDEIHHLNRKQRTAMAKSKSGQPVHQVIIQEGVYTFETWGPDHLVAEPVVYMWGSQVVGGFYRVHQERGVDENLNTPGMKFEPLAFAKTCQRPDGPMPDACQNRFYAYGVIARLSMLAAAQELLEQQK